MQPEGGPPLPGPLCSLPSPSNNYQEPWETRFSRFDDELGTRSSIFKITPILKGKIELNEIGESRLKNSMKILK